MGLTLRLLLAFILAYTGDVQGTVLGPMTSATNKQNLAASRDQAVVSPELPSSPVMSSAGPINARVVDVYNEEGGPRKKFFRVGSTIIVKVTHLQELKRLEVGDKKITLFLNGIPIKGLIRDDLNLATGQIRYRINWDDTTRASLDQLLCKPRFWIPTTVTVGFEDDFSIPTTVSGPKRMHFEVINPFGFAGWLLFTAAILFLFVHLARKTPLLRSADMESSFSLAYSQMAVWTLLVCSGYVFIYLITLQHPNLNSSMLILLGLSAGTALGGKVIDAGKTIPRSKGRYLDDILQDADGYTVARLQIFIWTIIMAGMFIVHIYAKLAMPDFDATLLTLMGISSGTYLGFKIPETKAPSFPQPQPQPPVPQPQPQP